VEWLTMTNLSVNPEYLEALAKKQESASNEAADAARAVTGLRSTCYATHGPISGVSNNAFGAAEQAHHEAVDSISKAATRLAAIVRTAKIIYQDVDGDLAGNIDAQVLDR